jgi:hypothetical protein
MAQKYQNFDWIRKNISFFLKKPLLAIFNFLQAEYILFAPQQMPESGR